jgi:hypothetical protein
MTWKLGKGARVRSGILTAMRELDASVPAQMSIAEIDTVGRAKDALAEAAKEIQRLSRWGW